jgi:acetyl esterase/lipase
MRTRTFKTTHILELQLDIYGSDETSTSPKPVIVWIHGGALISGTRSRIAPDQLDRYLGTGFVVISIDYRLAPETKLPLIVEDVEDAIGWIRDNGDEIGVDPNRLAVIGHSAGGYLTLLTGHRINRSARGGDGRQG